MLVKETTTVEREVHVAPCLECGGTDILLSDSNYSSFNQGGGKCKKCGRETMSGVGCLPKIDELAAIWNHGNDIPTLIQAEQDKIAAAEKRIAELKDKAGATGQLEPIKPDDTLMTAAEFREYEDNGSLTPDDGEGVWATECGVSGIPVSRTQPLWATHVVWYGR